MFSALPSSSAGEFEYAAMIAANSLARCSAVQPMNRWRQRDEVAGLTAHAAALPRMLRPSSMVPT